MVQQRQEDRLKKKKSGAAGLRFKSSKKSSVSTASGEFAGKSFGANTTTSGEGDVAAGRDASQVPFRGGKKAKKAQRKVQKVLFGVVPTADASSSTIENSPNTVAAVDPARLIAKKLRTLHPADERRAALKKRREARQSGETSPFISSLSSAQERLEAAKADMVLYDQAISTSLFQEDPFGAISQHLSSTMEVLKPLTPDVGRVPLPE